MQRWMPLVVIAVWAIMTAVLIGIAIPVGPAAH